MKHFTITFIPENKKISIHSGATLLEAAERADIILYKPCGGKGVCKKCKVNILPEQKSVLACQYKIDSEITVQIPPETRFFEHKIITHAVDTKTSIEPDVFKNYLDSSPQDDILGIAVDIGTTTIVARLVNMSSGNSIDKAAVLNPQTNFGDDVVTRISFAEKKENLTRLHNITIQCINELIDGLCRKNSINTQQIFEVSVVGNTTMNHIFLNLPIEQLGRAPYKPALLDACEKKPHELGLNINPLGSVYTPPNIAGFVGSDINAVALAVDIENEKQTSLIIDIGTNGEIVLAEQGSLFAASCAAGPALEGAGISSGSRATTGAIEAVIINDNDIDFDIIGNVEPCSICGSGLIDAVAVLLDLEIIDHTGKFKPSDSLKKLPPDISSRITQKDDQPAFILARPSIEGNKPILLTQRDIRQLQLAKAAISTGIKLLLQKLDINASDIESIYLAGAFGNYIKRENALKIGLLPDVPEEKIKFVGNAASTGAEMLLISSNCRKNARSLAKKIEYIEIANQKSFPDLFADSMMLAP